MRICIHSVLAHGTLAGIVGLFIVIIALYGFQGCLFIHDRCHEEMFGHDPCKVMVQILFTYFAVITPTIVLKLQGLPVSK